MRLDTTLDILEEFDASVIEGKYQEEERLKEEIDEVLEEAEATGRRRTSGLGGTAEETSVPRNWSVDAIGMPVASPF